MANADDQHKQPIVQKIAVQMQERLIRIVMEIDGTTLDATLEGNKTAEHFVSLLPLSLTLEDYAATEKIGDLPEKLSTQDAPAGYVPAAGDLAYYAPWGNLAIFHKNFRYSPQLVKLGHFDSGLEVLRKSGAKQVTIRRSEGEK
ncbi:cyclophilin-like fold protein [Pseudomonas syringae]|nr:cyclophilin-like fold protein [Pseudomonas syringae]